MSKRRQGKAKGGRAARHHEAQGFVIPPEKPHRRSMPVVPYFGGSAQDLADSLAARDLTADAREAVDRFFDNEKRREMMSELGFVEERMTPEQMAELITPNEEALD